MRLSLSEIEAIITCKNKIFAADSKIYLFGSRVDDSKKGGDIDLYIKTKNDSIENKIAYLALLSEYIDEQKVDVIFAKDSTRAIEIEAINQGIELDYKKIKLEKYFNQCDKHLQRIEEAYSDMEKIFPLTSEQYQNLTKDEVQDIDQYLFRFSKLQDTMGDKIFNLIVQQYEQNENILPFIDILNRLEKLGFLDNTKEWIYLRKLRNEISHTYDDEPQEMTQALNNIVNQKEIIKKIYLKLKMKHQVMLASISPAT